MADHSAIEWTDATWNPTVGCSRVAEGCRHCYAEFMAWRHVLMCKALGRRCKYEGTVELGPQGPRWTGVLRLDRDSLGTPLSWKRGRRIFVDSMSDLFHEGVSFEDIAAVFGVMSACPQHTFQILTKRPNRAVEFFAWIERQRRGVTAALVQRGGAWPDSEQSAESVLCAYHAREVLEPINRPLFAGWPLPNVHIGTSIAEQKDADKNIPYLLQIPAAVRFLSVEPLIGPVDLSPWLEVLSICKACVMEHDGHVPGACPSCGRDSLITTIGEGQAERLRTGERYDSELGEEDQSGRLPIGWVICGGESGKGARPMHPDWPRSLRDQCVAAGVPFFFKQWGEWLPGQNEPHPMQEWGLAHHQDGTWGARKVSEPDRYVWWSADGVLHHGLRQPGEPAVAVWAERVGKKSAGRLLDGREWNEFPSSGGTVSEEVA